MKKLKIKNLLIVLSLKTFAIVHRLSPRKYGDRLHISARTHLSVITVLKLLLHQSLENAGKIRVKPLTLT